MTTQSSPRGEMIDSTSDQTSVWQQKKIYLGSGRGKHRCLQSGRRTSAPHMRPPGCITSVSTLSSDALKMPQIQTSPSNQTFQSASLHTLLSQRPTFCWRAGGRGGVTHLLKMALTDVNNEFSTA